MFGFLENIDHSVTSPANTRHSTGQSAMHKYLLAQYQIATGRCTKSWASSACPFSHLAAFLLARAYSGRRQPRAERRRCTDIQMSAFETKNNMTGRDPQFYLLRCFTRYPLTYATTCVTLYVRGPIRESGLRILGSGFKILILRQIV